MTALRLLCIIGLHPKRQWQYIHPHDYVWACRECGRVLWKNY